MGKNSELKTLKGWESSRMKWDKVAGYALIALSLLALGTVLASPALASEAKTILIAGGSLGLVVGGYCTLFKKR